MPEQSRLRRRNQTTGDWSAYYLKDGKKVVAKGHRKKKTFRRRSFSLRISSYHKNALVGETQYIQLYHIKYTS